ncbi:MAG: hypothetical protein R3C69_04940 [Geminicoccaceae bacterium]
MLTAVGCTEARQAASSAWPVEPAADSAAVEPVEADSLASSYLAGRIAVADGDLRASPIIWPTRSARPRQFDLRREVFVLRLGVGDYPEALALARSLAEPRPGRRGRRFLMLVFEQVKAGDFAAGAALPEIADQGIVGHRQADLRRSGLPSAPATRQAAVDSLLAEERDDGLGAICLYHAAMMLALDGRTDARACSSRSSRVTAGRRPGRSRRSSPSRRRPARRGGIAGARGAAGADPGQQRARDGAGRPPGRRRSAAAGDRRCQRHGGRAAQPRPGAQRPDAEGQALLLARMAAYLAPSQGDVALLIAEISLAQGNPEEARCASSPTCRPICPMAGRPGCSVPRSSPPRTGRDEAIARLDQMADERRPSGSTHWSPRATSCRQDRSPIRRPPTTGRSAGSTRSRSGTGRFLRARHRS